MQIYYRDNVGVIDLAAVVIVVQVKTIETIYQQLPSVQSNISDVPRKNTRIVVQALGTICLMSTAIL